MIKSKDQNKVIILYLLCEQSLSAYIDSYGIIMYYKSVCSQYVERATSNMKHTSVHITSNEQSPLSGGLDSAVFDKDANNHKIFLAIGI